MKAYLLSSNHNILLQLLICVSSSFSAFAFKRIVNGIDAGENEFRFMVSLQRNGTHFCGGTILDESHILTAAHCVCNVNWDLHNLLEIKLTPLKLNDPNAVAIPIHDVVCNDYDVLELIRDIAILNLSQRIPTSFFQAVKLPESNFSTAVPLHGVVAGWGLTSTTGVVSNTLKKLDVVIYNDAMCTQSYSGIRNIEHQICSGWPVNDRGSCQGDSGGPLLVGDVQVGVISFGDDQDCAISDMEKPKISARITAYLNWIHEVIGSDKAFTEEEHTTTEQSSIVTSLETSTGEVNTENGGEEENEDHNFRTSTEDIRGSHNSSERSTFLYFQYIIVIYMQYKIFYN